MFSDDLSEVWDTSEFQDSFIKDYFGHRKVSTGDTKFASCPRNEFTTSVSSKKSSKGTLKRLQNDIEGEVLPESHLCKSKNNFNGPVTGSTKKRKKLSNAPSDDNFTDNHRNNLELEETKSNYPLPDSSSLKSRKKRKRKPKNKNKVTVEEQPLLNSSHHGTSKQMNDSLDLQEEETFSVSNNSQSNSIFQNKLCQKLQGAKFRYLNEMLYTSTGKDAFLYFHENKEEFQDYHVGYQSQVSKWPINPVDIIIEELCHMNKQNIIADLGCGEAKIAEAFPKRTVHSFDLIALKDSVTACDMANVPLPSGSVDVVVFCLSLMGTNWKDYLKEGHRLLKLGGELMIAEIESRVDDMEDFIKNIQAHGFSLVNKDESHKMFIFLNFKKVKNKVKASKIPEVTLKPCLYKRR